MSNLIFDHIQREEEESLAMALEKVQETGQLRYFDKRFTLDSEYKLLVRPSRMFNRLYSSVKVEELGLLPPGTVWVSPRHRYLLLAEPPALHRMHVRYRSAPACTCEYVQDEDGEWTDEISVECDLCRNGHYDDSIEVHGGVADGWGTFLLPFPWIYYLIEISRGAVTLRRMLTSTHAPANDAPLSAVPLPNVYDHGSICEGSAAVATFAPDTSSSLVAAVGVIIQNFWSSSFNFDVTQYKHSPVWKALVEEVEQYWDDGKVWEFWEGLDLDEAMELLPWTRQPLYSLEELREKQTEAEHPCQLPQNQQAEYFCRYMRDIAVYARDWANSHM